MYTLLQAIPLRRVIVEQLPALLISFVIAERFYKFHSFTLECIAFLFTWFVVDAGINLIKSVSSGSSGT